MLAVLLPALLVSGGAAWHLAGSYRQAFEIRLEDTARALALFVDSELATQIATVSALASSPLLERDDLVAFEAWARVVAGAVDGWIVVNEAAPGQRQLLNTALPEGAPLPPPAPAGVGAFDGIGRVVETGRAAVSDLFRGYASGRLTVVAAAPSFQEGRMTRVVVLAMRPARLSERLQDRRPSGGAYVSIADGAGRIVARSQDHDRYVGTVPPSRNVPGAQRARGVFRSTTVYGDVGVFAAQPLRNAEGWTLVVAESAARYREAWLAPLAVLAAGAAAVLATGLLAAAWLARRVLRPVGALVRRAEAVAAGGEGGSLPPVPPASVAEFDALRAASERAERALAAREAEFRAMFETAAAGVAEVDLQGGRYLRANRHFLDLAGRSEAALLGGLGPADILRPGEGPEEGQDAATTAGGAAADGGTVGRLLRPDGAPIWVQWSTAVSARDAAGRPSRAVTVLQDITGRRQAEAARGLLAREVDHRAKNVLAVVQAVLRLTPKDDLASYSRAVEARVAALSRAHTLLAEAHWGGAALHALAGAELSAFQPVAPAAGGPVEPDEVARAAMDGPPVTLLPSASQAVSMVLHELATNAAKYGALSVPGGRVALSWRLERDLLRLRWAERGGPPVRPPSRRGFGSRVIEATVRDQLGGAAEPEWEASGVVWRIALPLARVAVPEAAG